MVRHQTTAGMMKPDEEIVLVDSGKTPVGNQLYAVRGHRLYWKSNETPMT